MSIWAGLQITLEHVFESATGIGFVWDDEPRKIIQKPFGVLSLGQSITVGRDCGSYTFRDSDSTVDIVGYRELTINVQVYSRQARGERSARDLIERARLLLANPVYRDELRSAGLVFVESHPVTNLDFTFQNRAENRSAFDVVFRLVLCEQLPAKIPYFETIALEDSYEPQ
jgi:hypothetical protein